MTHDVSWCSIRGIMIIDGKQIAADVLAEVKRSVSVCSLASAPKLAVVTVAPNFATKKYLEMKRNQAAAVGIKLVLQELPASASTAEVKEKVIALSQGVDGVIVQLPLPKKIDTDAVIAAIPIDKDPDGFSYTKPAGTSCLPPVAAAIDEIAKLNNISFIDKKIIVLGNGRLVGAPAAKYLRGQGADVQVFTVETYDASALKTADVIVSGIGRPNFITADLVKEGVMVFDAGTSEDNGVLAGDFDQAVADKSSLFTPVPGGIGPLTIACLLRNLIDISSQG